MQIQRTNNFGIAISQATISDSQKTTYAPMINSKIMTDSIAFKAQPLKPNQVLPATEKLILRAVKQIKIEKNKIIAALNKTWESYAMGKVSNIYIGHKEIPLDKNEMEWLHQRIQLTGDIPGHKRVYFSASEPNRYSLDIYPVNEKIKSKENTMYDIDFRTSDEGIITEFDPDMGKESSDPAVIRQLNERVQYCLKALFPKKAPKTTPK